MIEAPIWQPVGSENTVEAFHRLYFDKGRWAIQWKGHTVLKWPGDLFTYAEILHKNRVDALIETGTAYGGSALFFADVMDTLGRGCVITIDREVACQTRPQHSRIIYLEGDSIAMAAEVKAEIPKEWRVMVSLDSDHKKDHVVREINAYKDLVTPGQYLVVEDTDLNGHPVYPTHGPGPYEAVQEFDDPAFKIDSQMATRHMFSMHTWLRKEE